MIPVQLQPKNSPIAIFAVIVLGILAFAQLVSITYSTSPTTASKPELWAFFISLLVAITTILSGTWHAIRRTILRMQLRNVSFFVSYRQAFLVSLVITVSFFLNSLSVFQVFDLLPLLIAVVLLEFFFQAEKTPHASIRHEDSNS